MTDHSATTIEAIKNWLSFSRFGRASNWETFDLRRLGETVWGYAESTFDGRYVYYGTQRTYETGRDDDGAHSRMLRFDTQRPFDDISSWEVFDASDVAGQRGSFEALAFDGRFVFFGPYFTGPNLEVHPFRICLRFDTQKSFSDRSAWTRFDAGQIDGDLYGYCGAKRARNGIYFSPYHTGTMGRNLFLRYDGNGAFDNPASWAVFDSATVIPAAKGYNGVETDGHFVYYGPCYNQNTDRTNTLMARYDLAGDFRDPKSWEFFDLASAARNPSLGGYHGSLTFDGRYVYYVPLYAPRPCTVEHINHGWLTRFDTTRPFQDLSSWQTFDARTIRANVCGYSGAGFDGRYVYYCPVRCCEHKNHGRFLRYDTWRDFQNSASYELFDATKRIDKRLVYFDGQISFDGTYVYYPAPTTNALMMRFRTRTKLGRRFGLGR